MKEAIIILNTNNLTIHILPSKTKKKSLKTIKSLLLIAINVRTCSL